MNKKNHAGAKIGMRRDDKRVFIFNGTYLNFEHPSKRLNFTLTNLLLLARTLMLLLFQSWYITVISSKIITLIQNLLCLIH